MGARALNEHEVAREELHILSEAREFAAVSELASELRAREEASRQRLVEALEVRVLAQQELNDSLEELNASQQELTEAESVGAATAEALAAAAHREVSRWREEGAQWDWNWQSSSWWRNRDEGDG